jgi:hypothetical protein
LNSIQDKKRAQARFLYSLRLAPLDKEGLNSSFKLGARIRSWIVPLGKGGQKLLTALPFTISWGISG